MAAKQIVINGEPVTLDARPDRLDLRDLPYRPAVRALPHRFPADGDLARLTAAYVRAGLVLDQGEDGACTGFGLAAVINFLLWTQRGATGATAERVSTRMLYHLARFYDEWPGEDYDGSSCRGALKGWHKHGVCNEDKWRYHPTQFIPPDDDWDRDAVTRPLGVYYRIDRASVVDMQAAIADTGAIYVASDVHDGWSLPERKTPRRHDDLPRVAIRPKADGGHAFALVGYNEWGFVVQNSWGTGWGAQGFAVVPYEDWVTHGADAWTVGLGVPVELAVTGQQRGRAVMAAPRHFVASQPKVPQTEGSPGWMGGTDPLAGKAGAWSEGEAYAHTLVTGNDGVIVNHLADVADAAASAEKVSLTLPLRWLRAQPPHERRLVVYAHGGLNSKAASIARIRMLAPYFERNGIYPLFVTWQTGWLETLGNALEDRQREVFGAPLPQTGLTDALIEASDRMLEGACRVLPARALWSEMKENAGASTEEGRGIAVLSHHLESLARTLGGDLKLHLVGHSAGAFIVGRLLSRLTERGLGTATCTLLAPACDLAFAQSHFAASVDAGRLARDRFVVHALADARERDDCVGPYRKSLLYLVSRALERQHKTPLLGLANAFDPAHAGSEWWHEDWVDDVALWQHWFWGAGGGGTDDTPSGFAETGASAPGGGLFVTGAKSVNAGPRAVPATHGAFDNDVDVVAMTIRRMLGLPGGSRLPFPVTDLDY